MYFHHFIVVFGSFLSVNLGGFTGSTNHISFITEGSTFFVNMRLVMLVHKLEGELIYILNGIMMGLAFFVFRIVWYHIIIWTYVDDTIFKRYYTLWPVLYPTPIMDFFGNMCIVLYFMLFLLQLFWFSKIFAGILKAVGLEKLLSC